jgi:hypothetical protein
LTEATKLLFDGTEALAKERVIFPLPKCRYWN